MTKNKVNRKLKEIRRNKDNVGSRRIFKNKIRINIFIDIKLLR